IPANLVKAGNNLITVRVLDLWGNGGFTGKPEQMSLEMPGGQATPISLAGEWKYQASINSAEHPYPPERADGTPNNPTVLYNGMINPLVPMAIKGAIWYQGESNAGYSKYQDLLTAMITDWRTRFGVGDFSFYIVQLANYMQREAQPADPAWARLREAQTRTAAKVRNCGLAVAIDIGDAADIHPKNKQEVGRRLALNALALTYGKRIEYAGPTYREMKQEGKSIRLSFDHIAGGLIAKGADGKLTGFAIAGADKKFVWADAVIDGETIIVSSPQVPEPVAVRYAWGNNPDCNLFNKADLPAGPFRTDSF
ncbi:MAG TPA: sialate O-acetylesterase, partial [Armatimonadota bacterium]